jgi:ATP-dependent RNA helicase DeaD
MFTDYPLAPQVQRALLQKGFSTPTPIQAQTLPHSLAGRDILGQARTGTGKTLAFGLPIASRLQVSDARGRAPRALILTPTRELALQVATELAWLAPHLMVVAVYGGTGYGKQAAELKRGSDIVVATPGRALDYLKQGALMLSKVEVAVLDEADEMLSMGFEEEVETLLAATPKARQTMLFSATLPNWAKKLAGEHLSEPVQVNVMQEEAVTYQEIAIEASVKHRLGILSDILHAHHGDKAIIFTHTKAEVDSLAKALSLQGHAAEAIHGDLNQPQRERVLSRFRAGQVSALIGTNVAARGLDIPEVDLVVHYRIPTEAEAYQHRSGRTGRAGRSGTVIILYGSREKRELQQLERAVGRSFTRSTPPTPETIQEAKLSNLLHRARMQSQTDKDAWQDIAAELIESGDAETLAGLFALVLGGAPAPRSLLTGEDNWVTLELTGDIANVGQVMRLLKAAGATVVGRIQLEQQAAYADVLPEEAAQLIARDHWVTRARSVPVATAGRDIDKRRSRPGAGARKRRRNEARY